MAAHVHEHAAARLLHIVEPVAVRARVLLQLLEHVDVAYRALLHEPPHALVLRREAQLFRVHQLATGRVAGRNHLVGLFERHAQRLFDDHVLSGSGGRQRGSMMQQVGKADVHDFAVRLGDRAIDVGEPMRNVVPRGKRLRPLRAP